MPSNFHIGDMLLNNFAEFGFFQSAVQIFIEFIFSIISQQCPVKFLRCDFIMLFYLTPKLELYT